MIRNCIVCNKDIQVGPKDEVTKSEALWFSGYEGDIIPGKLLKKEEIKVFGVLICADCRKESPKVYKLYIE